jgi:hypothetical protein
MQPFHVTGCTRPNLGKIPAPGREDLKGTETSWGNESHVGSAWATYRVTGRPVRSPPSPHPSSPQHYTNAITRKPAKKKPSS